MKQTVIIYLVLWFGSGWAWADDPVFKIELVIFAQNSHSTEVFRQTQSAIDWPSRMVSNEAYPKVDPAYLRLGGIAERLDKHGAYRLLQHLAWLQTIPSNSLSVPVRIQNPEGTLNGYFRIQRGHLVHLLTDIEYTPLNAGAIYRLSEKRRFKFNEIHYLDHPKFGVITRVTPIND
jgi:hypothetical protein